MLCQSTLLVYCLDWSYRLVVRLENDRQGSLLLCSSCPECSHFYLQVWWGLSSGPSAPVPDIGPNQPHSAAGLPLLSGQSPHISLSPARSLYEVSDTNPILSFYCSHCLSQIYLNAGVKAIFAGQISFIPDFLLSLLLPTPYNFCISVFCLSQQMREAMCVCQITSSLVWFIFHSENVGFPQKIIFALKREAFVGWWLNMNTKKKFICESRALCSAAASQNEHTSDWLDSKCPPAWCIKKIR